MTDSIRLIDENGSRTDGRTADQLRAIRMEAGVLENAEGSAYVEWGGNKVIAGVYGPREMHPRHKQDPFRAVVQCRYNMSPFSVEDRKRPGMDRRSTEISKVLSDALSHVVIGENFPRTAVDIYIEVLQAEAGTRTVGLNAASVALADAGVPIRDFVTACAVGKVDDTLVIDLNKAEDNKGQADLPVGMVVNTGEIVLMQMDGHLTPDEFSTAMDMVETACREIHGIQIEAVKNRYQGVEE